MEATKHRTSKRNGTGGKGARAPKPAARSKPRPATGAGRAGRMSALDAAAKVLADAGKPMRAGEIVKAMEDKGLWKSKAGKTPQATVYASIIREIAAKGKKSRFVKKDRGLFVSGR